MFTCIECGIDDVVEFFPVFACTLMRMIGGGRVHADYE